MCVLRCALPLSLCLSSSLSLCLCLFVYIAQDRCVPCRWAQGLLRGTTAFRMRFMNKLPIAITKSRETGRAREGVRAQLATEHAPSTSLKISARAQWGAYSGLYMWYTIFDHSSEGQLNSAFSDHDVGQAIKVSNYLASFPCSVSLLL